MEDQLMAQIWIDLLLAGITYLGACLIVAWPAKNKQLTKKG
jgi:hypothetical protein